MSTESTQSEKGIGNRLTHFYLGCDGEGDYHHFDRDRGVVFTITADGDRPFVDELHESQLEEYRAYVADRRGDWQEIVILPIMFTPHLEDRR